MTAAGTRLAAEPEPLDPLEALVAVDAGVEAVELEVELVVLDELLLLPHAPTATAQMMAGRATGQLLGEILTAFSSSILLAGGE